MSGTESMIGRVRALVAGVVGASVVLLSPTTADAQFRGGWGGGEMFESPMPESELEKIAEMLGLDEDVRMLAESMLEAMETEFDTHRDEMRQIMDDARDEFRDTRDFTVWEDLRPIMEDFGEKREDIEAAFVEDMKMLLNDDQLEMWPKVERMRVRTRSLRNGLLSGETVDLIDLAEASSFEPEIMDSIVPVLDQYELELDRALKARNDVYEEGMSKAMELWRAQDMETIDKLFKDATEAAERVRDTNRRYMRQVAQLLPEGSQEAFEQAFREKSFPRVYRQSYLNTAIESAKLFDDLTVDQRDEMATLEEAYKRDAGSVNARWATAIEESESNRSFRSMFRGGGDDSEASREARRERRELDTRFEDQLLGILTEEQIERLPEREQRDFRERGRDRFQRGGRERGERGGDRGDRGERGDRGDRGSRQPDSL